MGIFGSLRNLVNGYREESELWNQPQSVGEIVEILSRFEKPQVIYKHSYSCAVSLFAKSSLESGLESASKQADFHLVDVIAQRELTKKIAETTGIRHESPQVIVMYNGFPFWNASHGDVQIDALRDALNEI